MQPFLLSLAVMKFISIYIILLFSSLNGGCQSKSQNLEFKAFGYFVHLDSDILKELKWFTCSDISIKVLVQDSIDYKRVEINKKPDSLQMFVTSMKQHFIDKENIAWVYLNASSKKTGDVIVKFGLFDKSKKLNGTKHVGYLIIISKESSVGYALTF